MGRPAGSKNGVRNGRQRQEPIMSTALLEPTTEPTDTDVLRLKAEIAEEKLKQAQAELEKLKASTGVAVAQQGRDPRMSTRKRFFLDLANRHYVKVEGNSPQHPTFESPLDSFLNKLSYTRPGEDMYEDHGCVPMDTKGNSICTHGREHLLSCSIEDHEYEVKQNAIESEAGVKPGRESDQYSPEGTLIKMRPRKWAELGVNDVRVPDLD